MKKILGITVVCIAMLSVAPVYAVNLGNMKKNNPEYNKKTKKSENKIDEEKTNKFGRVNTNRSSLNNI